MSVKNYEQLERDLAGARAEIDRLVRWGGSAVVARDAAVAEISRLQKSLEDKPDAIDLKNQIANLKAELAKHQESEFHPDWSLLQAAQKSLREASAEVDRLKSECEYLGKSVSQLTETRLSLEDTVDRLKKDNADLQQQRDAVQSAKDFLELTIQRKDQETERLTAEVSLARGDSDTDNRLVEIQADSIRRLRAELAELKSTRPQSAAEVLAAVRCEAAPHGWSDRTVREYHVLFFRENVYSKGAATYVGLVDLHGTAIAVRWSGRGVDLECLDHSWGGYSPYNLVPLPAPAECTAEPLPPSTPTQPPTADPGIPSASEVLSAVRSAAAPRGWSDITAGGHRVVAAFFDDAWGRIAAVIDLGEDCVAGRYVENAWNADSGKGYRGAGCDLVPATEIETWGISDPLPPPVPDPDCQPDATDEPPPCMVPIDHAEIEIRTVDRMFAVPSEIVRRGNYEVITCDHLRIVRPRQ